MIKARPYYADGSLSAAFYDVVTGADPNLPGDVEAYAGLARPGATVLELGAGAGRIAFALAERGFAVTGVDLSPSMLARAQARLATAAAEIAERLEFRQGDMTALRLGRTFDLVICPYFTLAHVPAGAAWRNTFQAMADHLAQGGLAAVHLPLLELMSGPGAAPGALVLDQPLPSGGRLQIRMRDRRFREAVGRLDQVLEYMELDAAGRPLRQSPERLTYYVADPAPFASAAGLRLDRPPQRLGQVGDIFVYRRA